VHHRRLHGLLGVGLPRLDYPYPYPYPSPYPYPYPYPYP